MGGGILRHPGQGEKRTHATSSVLVLVFTGISLGFAERIVLHAPTLVGLPKI